MHYLTTIRVNEALVAAATAWAKQICAWISSRTIQLNLDLAERFKVIETKLLKRPVDTSEMVEQARFTKQLKSHDKHALIVDCVEVSVSEEAFRDTPAVLSAASRSINP